MQRETVTARVYRAAGEAGLAQERVEKAEDFLARHREVEAANQAGDMEGLRGLRLDFGEDWQRDRPRVFTKRQVELARVPR